jgi:peptide-methionine (S)-S-oxide reductase
MRRAFKLSHTLSHLTGMAFLCAGLTVGAVSASAQEGLVIPPPSVDQTSETTAKETAIFAGGCFWGVQGVYQRVAGVDNAVSGYAGGAKDTATYETVSNGKSGHAEAVRITFDPKKVSYGHLLQIYFSVAHDPTQLNRQGPDVGTQYRSTVFPTSEEQARIAKAYIDQLNNAHIYKAAIVTSVEQHKAFYPAEAYHQDFLTNNPTYPYIVYNDMPKIENLEKLFPKDYRKEPVLVAKMGVGN